jgi:saccharopine dehydrogenase-like NADP-dependent oxidoreductase
MKYIVIGGAGQMGRIAVRDLAAFAEESDEIVVADYDGAKATEVARALGDARVSALQLDVRDSVKSARALAGAFVLLNCLQHT